MVSKQNIGNHQLCIQYYLHYLHCKNWISCALEKVTFVYIVHLIRTFKGIYETITSKPLIISSTLKSNHMRGLGLFHSHNDIRMQGSGRLYQIMCLLRNFMTVFMLILGQVKKGLTIGMQARIEVSKLTTSCERQR